MRVAGVFVNSRPGSIPTLQTIRESAWRASNAWAELQLFVYALSTPSTVPPCPRCDSVPVGHCSLYQPYGFGRETIYFRSHMNILRVLRHSPTGQRARFLVPIRWIREALRRELAQLVAHHLFGNGYVMVYLAVMHLELETHEVREYGS